MPAFPRFALIGVAGAPSPVPLPWVGPYELVRRLGRGGMGEVWLARVEKIQGLTKWLALKLIAIEAGTRPDALLREARVSLLLSHSNIVGVFDAGIDGEHGYFAMEWVDGIDLAHVIRVRREHGAGVVGEKVAVFVIAQVLRALAYAYGLEHEGRALQLVHRDISPSNVLVSRDGEVKLADFGIARSRLSSTTDEKVKGKVRYMAPEQFAGAALDARADLFAVGAILHELLSGQPLRTGESAAEIVGQIASSGVPDLVVPVSPDIDAARRWLLEPDPTRRAASAAEVLGWLRSRGFDFDATAELAQICQSITGRHRPTDGSDALGSPAREPPTEALGGDPTVAAGPGDATTHTHAPSQAGAQVVNAGAAPAPRRSRVVLSRAVAAVVALLVLGSLTWGAAALVRDRREAEPSAPSPTLAAATAVDLEPAATTVDLGLAAPSVGREDSTAPPSRKPTGLSSKRSPDLRGPGQILLLFQMCPVDPDGDGLNDVLARVHQQGSLRQVVFALLDGSTGAPRQSATHDRLHPMDVEIKCLPNGLAVIREDDETIELWSAADLTAPRLTLADVESFAVETGKGCVRVGGKSAFATDRRELSSRPSGPEFAPVPECLIPPWSERVEVTLEVARATADFPAARPAGTRDTFEVRYDGDGGRRWQRELDAPDNRRPLRLAIGTDRVWTTTRSGRPHRTMLVGLDRNSGATVVEVELETVPSEFMVADPQRVLIAGSGTLCAHAIDTGQRLWCLLP